MSASEQTGGESSSHAGGESSSHAVVAEHPLATYEWLTSRVLSLIDDAREVGRLAVQKSLPQLDHLTAIFSNAIHQPLLHLSKRDLHLKLCSSVLSDDGLKRFWIDPASGEGCYMISARALSICWGENPTYWRWTPWPGAMSGEVAYLNEVCWFDISGVFRQVLKPGNYRVSFRMQLCSSWGDAPVTLSLEDTASAYPPHVSEVFFDGRTNFKRRRCTPLAQTLEPENGIDIGEEGTDGDGSDDGHDHTADGLNGSDDYHRHSDNHNNEDDNECEDDGGHDSNDDDDDNDDDNDNDDNGDEDSNDDNDDNEHRNDDDDDGLLLENNAGIREWLELDLGQFSVQDRNED